MQEHFRYTRKRKRRRKRKKKLENPSIDLGTSRIIGAEIDTSLLSERSTI